MVFHPLLVCHFSELPDAWMDDKTSLHNIKDRAYKRLIYRQCPLVLIKYIFMFDLAALQDLPHVKSHAR